MQKVVQNREHQDSQVEVRAKVVGSHKKFKNLSIGWSTTAEIPPQEYRYKTTLWRGEDQKIILDEATTIKEFLPFNLSLLAYLPFRTYLNFF